MVSRSLTADQRQAPRVGERLQRIAPRLQARRVLPRSRETAHPARLRTTMAWSRRFPWVVVLLGSMSVLSYSGLCEAPCARRVSQSPSRARLNFPVCGHVRQHPRWRRPRHRSPARPVRCSMARRGSKSAMVHLWRTRDQRGHAPAGPLCTPLSCKARASIASTWCELQTSCPWASDTRDVTLGLAA